MRVEGAITPLQGRYSLPRGGSTLCLGALHPIRAVDITLKVALRQNNVRRRGGIPSAVALFTAEGRHHVMRGRTEPYKDG